MIIKPKKILYQLSAALLTSTLLFGCSLNLDGEHNSPLTEPNEESEVEASEKDSEEDVEVLIEIFINGSEQKEFTHLFEVKEGETLLGLMSEHYRIVSEDGSIKCIEGNAQNTSEDKYWKFKVNGNLSEDSAEEYVLKESDKIKWELEVNE